MTYFRRIQSDRIILGISWIVKGDFKRKANNLLPWRAFATIGSVE
jgi:hypothetical protein